MRFEYKEKLYKETAVNSYSIFNEDSYKMSFENKSWKEYAFYITEEYILSLPETEQP